MFSHLQWSVFTLGLHSSEVKTGFVGGAGQCHVFSGVICPWAKIHEVCPR